MVHKIIKEVRSDAGKKHKEKVLTDNNDNTLLFRVLEMAYSPFIRYGIKRIPEYTPATSPTLTLELALDELMRLANREVTGNTGIDHLSYILENSSLEDSELISLIIGGSLKMGCEVSTINKAFGKNSIKETPYQGAATYSASRVQKIIDDQCGLDKDGNVKGVGFAISQLKMDGRFSNLTVDNGTTASESRQGLPAFLGESFSHYSFFEERFGEPLVLNGELIIAGYEQQRLIGNGIVSSLVSIGGKINEGDDVTKEKEKFKKRFGESYEEMLTKLKIVIWDFIPLSIYLHSDTWDEVDYLTRLLMIEEWVSSAKESGITNIEVVEWKKVRTVSEAFDHLLEQLALGNEGTILKSPSAFWKDGKPTYQVKMKLEMDLDLEVVAGNFGKKGTKNVNVISSLSVKSSCGSLVANAYGMNEDVMDWVTENIDDLIGTIITVKCNGISRNAKGGWSLFYPNVKQFRDDKTVANSLEECIEIEEAAKLLNP